MKLKSIIDVEVKTLKLEVAVRYEEEDIPNHFPGRVGDVWYATIDLKEHRILGWPQGETGEFYMKICDEGSYYLLDENNKIVASIEGNYVPNELLPGKYGDYLEMKINEDGVITNWSEAANLSDFEVDDD